MNKGGEEREGEKNFNLLFHKILCEKKKKLSTLLFKSINYVPSKNKKVNSIFLWSTTLKTEEKKIGKYSVLLSRFRFDNIPIDSTTSVLFQQQPRSLHGRSVQPNRRRISDWTEGSRRRRSPPYWYDSVRWPRFGLRWRVDRRRLGR
jgi:hypothetical protein